LLQQSCNNSQNLFASSPLLLQQFKSQNLFQPVVVAAAEQLEAKQPEPFLRLLLLKQTNSQTLFDRVVAEAKQPDPLLLVTNCQTLFEPDIAAVKQQKPHRTRCYRSEIARSQTARTFSSPLLQQTKNSQNRFEPVVAAD
jgi:hypothetical protein